jgi:methionine aminopeptidase
MVKKIETIVTLTDDLDGGKADRTVMFAVNGTNYEIDLSKKNAAALDRALKPYVEAGRKVRRSGRRASAGAAAGRNSHRDLAAVREWARANGHEVSGRGRISASIVDEYEAAH